jgi:phosphate transport system ATP-binding protein
MTDTGVAKIVIRKLNFHYGPFHALGDITLDIYANAVTAIIGPSGCGKSTFLRVLNRMNDLIPIAKASGEVLLDNIDIYNGPLNVAALRKKVGMVFQKPNLFPITVFENITIGPRRYGVKNKKALMEITERSLRQVALWEELKDQLNKPALGLQAGEQQRLCIARAIAQEPDVLLMDESCSALDPESTMKIEELMRQLKQTYTIVIVTHNMEQARRASDYSLFFMINDDMVGRLVEYDKTTKVFGNPKDPRTNDYITGRFG